MTTHSFVQLTHFSCTGCWFTEQGFLFCKFQVCSESGDYEHELKGFQERRGKLHFPSYPFNNPALLCFQRLTSLSRGNGGKRMGRSSLLVQGLLWQSLFLGEGQQKNVYSLTNTYLVPTKYKILKIRTEIRLNCVLPPRHVLSQVYIFLCAETVF